MLFPIKIALFLREIVLFYINFITNFLICEAKSKIIINNPDSDFLPVNRKGCTFCLKPLKPWVRRWRERRRFQWRDLCGLRRRGRSGCHWRPRCPRDRTRMLRPPSKPGMSCILGPRCKPSPWPRVSWQRWETKPPPTPGWTAGVFQVRLLTQFPSVHNQGSVKWVCFLQTLNQVLYQLFLKESWDLCIWFATPDGILVSLMFQKQCTSNAHGPLKGSVFKGLFRKN